MRFSVPLKIHVWGGLGSQLHAWALAESLQLRRNRRIILVLHTSGVTRRESDINFLSGEFAIQHLEDFEVAKPEVKGSNRFKLLVKQIIKNLLKSLSIVLDDSRLESISRIRPWTLSLRGHYTQVVVRQETLLLMVTKARRAGLLNLDKPLIEGTLFHYRLGDLMTIESKSPLDPSRFQNLPSLVLPLQVMSDSIDRAQQLLSVQFSINITPVVDKSPWDAISIGIRSQVFVGTPSKLSFWIIAIRSTLKIGTYSYITREHLENIALLTENSHSANIKTY
jgi:hypothetical protein